LGALVKKRQASLREETYRRDPAAKVNLRKSATPEVEEDATGSGKEVNSKQNPASK